MKKIQYIIMTLACVLLASCMADDYAAPETDEAPFGNNYIEETNVITIAQLKAKYATVIANDDMKQITDDIQIKGVVVGNDIEGNIYTGVAEVMDDPVIRKYQYIQYANLFDEIDPAWFEVQ